MAIFRHARESRFELGVGELKNNELRVMRFRGTEAISKLYHFDLELVSDDASVDFKAVIGQEATLLIGAENVDRYVNGIVSRFEQGAVGKRFTSYYAELVPRQWMLLHRVNTRIFQDKSVLEIVEQVMTDAGLPTDSWRKVNLGSYKPREYCVQYAESDWAFISRLLEEEGIFYFFAHEEGDHALLLGDKPAAHLPIGGDAKIPFRETAVGATTDHIPVFRRGESVRPGAVLLRNFSFKMPKANLDAKQKAQEFEELEVYEYDQGAFATADLGKQWARVRLEEQQATRQTASGASTVERLTPGYRFTLDEHARSDFNVEYLITEVSHEGYEPEALEQYTATRKAGEEEYSNEFQCIPYDVPFRPPRVTPRPYIRGTQTATVVGPSGSEIYTDEYGRVKLHFHWDRYGSLDEQSSCWVRVSQQVAGGGFGFLALPRVGHEVVVAFHEGDPDQPHVTGRVYNKDNMPPYELPTHKTQTVIKTNSYDGTGFNEIRFEDKGGEEQLFLFAQRNMDIRVQSNRYESVGKEYHRTVEQNEYVWVKNERQTKVAADDITAIGGDQHLKVTGKRATQITGSDSLTVVGDRIEVFQANHSESTAGNLYVKGMGIVIESMTGLTIKTAGSSVVVDASGVTLTGPTVTLDGQISTLINSGPGSPAMSGSAGSAVSPLDPSEAEPADDSDPGKIAEAKAYQQETGTGKYGKRNLTPYQPTPEDQKNPKKTWIEIELVDEEGKPVPGEAYEVTLPDGTQVARGSLDHKGFKRIEGIDPGNCKITFPRLDKDAWERT